MKEIVGALDEIEDDDIEKLIGFEEITGHLVFDIRLGEIFRRKARYCADGHKTSTPSSITYSTVVARDSVRIILLTAALNDVQVMAADVNNAFLTASNKEKIWIRAGPEFVSLEGKPFIVRAALYGLNSASASFRAPMA